MPFAQIFNSWIRSLAKAEEKSAEIAVIQAKQAEYKKGT